MMPKPRRSRCVSVLEQRHRDGNADQATDNQQQTAFPANIAPKRPQIGGLHADAARHHQRHGFERLNTRSRMAPATAEKANPESPETNAPANTAALSSITVVTSGTIRSGQS
jgi:hypothetical protein